MSKSSLPQPHEVLRRFLARKQEFNPAYSVRALARDLDLSVSYVSGLLNGKKSFPSQRFAQIADKLGLDEMGRQLLSESLMAHSIQKSFASLPDVPRSRVFSKKAKVRAIHKFVEASQRQYPALSNWYTIAIMDLVTCSNFRPDEDWIARRLGITRVQAGAALRYLKESGLVQEKEGRLIKARKKMRIPTMKSHDTVRAFHGQMIQLALQELRSKTDDESFEKRLISGVTIASNPGNVLRARRRFHEAMYEIADILAQGECTELYQINAQLFPLTRKAD